MIPILEVKPNEQIGKRERKRNRTCAEFFISFMIKFSVAQFMTQSELGNSFPKDAM